MRRPGSLIPLARDLHTTRPCLLGVGMKPRAKRRLSTINNSQNVSLHRLSTNHAEIFLFPGNMSFLSPSLFHFHFFSFFSFLFFLRFCDCFFQMKASQSTSDDGTNCASLFRSKLITSRLAAGEMSAFLQSIKYYSTKNRFSARMN